MSWVLISLEKWLPPQQWMSVSEPQDLRVIKYIIQRHILYIKCIFLLNNKYIIQRKPWASFHFEQDLSLSEPFSWRNSNTDWLVHLARFSGLTRWPRWPECSPQLDSTLDKLLPVSRSLTSLFLELLLENTCHPFSAFCDIHFLKSILPVWQPSKVFLTNLGITNL